jgi:hypothetical protein
MHRWDALRPERSTGNNSPSLTRTQRIAPKWLYPRTFDFEIHISAWILDHISHVQRVLKPQFHMHYRLSTSSWFMHCMSSPLIVVQYLIHVHGFLSRVGKLMSIYVQILWLTPSIKLHRYGKSTTIKSIGGSATQWCFFSYIESLEKTLSIKLHRYIYQEVFSFDFHRILFISAWFSVKIRHRSQKL